MKIDVNTLEPGQHIVLRYGENGRYYPFVAIIEERFKSSDGQAAYKTNRGMVLSHEIDFIAEPVEK